MQQLSSAADDARLFAAQEFHDAATAAQAAAAATQGQLEQLDPGAAAVPRSGALAPVQAYAAGVGDAVQGQWAALRGAEVQAYLVVFLIFGWLWAAQMVRAIGWTAMSGAVSHWFFFRDNPSARSRCPILLSLWRTLRYHLGSVAFGALLIALTQA